MSRSAAAKNQTPRDRACTGSGGPDCSHSCRTSSMGRSGYNHLYQVFVGCLDDVSEATIDSTCGRASSRFPAARTDVRVVGHGAADGLALDGGQTLSAPGSTTTT